VVEPASLDQAREPTRDEASLAERCIQRIQDLAHLLWQEGDTLQLAHPRFGPIVDGALPDAMSDYASPSPDATRRFGDDNSSKM
jgi:hypothetical protein